MARVGGYVPATQGRGGLINGPGSRHSLTVKATHAGRDICAITNQAFTQSARLVGVTAVSEPPGIHFPPAPHHTLLTLSTLLVGVTEVSEPPGISSTLAISSSHITHSARLAGVTAVSEPPGISSTLAISPNPTAISTCQREGGGRDTGGGWRRRVAGEAHAATVCASS